MNTIEQLFYNLYHLLLCNRKIDNNTIRIQLNIQRSKKFLTLIPHILLIYNTKLVVRFPTNKDISTYPSLTYKHLDLLPRFGLVFMSYSTAYSLCHKQKEPQNKTPTSNEIQILAKRLKKLGLNCVVIPYSLSGSCIINANHGLIMEADHPGSTKITRKTYRFYRDAAMASVVYSQQKFASDYDLLLHLSATKLIAASSIRLSDTNYCEALVQSTIGELLISTICFDI